MLIPATQFYRLNHFEVSAQNTYIDFFLIFLSLFISRQGCNSTCKATNRSAFKVGETRFALIPQVGSKELATYISSVRLHVLQRLLDGSSLRQSAFKEANQHAFTWTARYTTSESTNVFPLRSSFHFSSTNAWIRPATARLNLSWVSLARQSTG